MTMNEEKEIEEEQEAEQPPKKNPISEETYNYYKRVHETFRGLDDENDRGLFFTNVFRQLEKEALLICQHKILSFNIENLLKSTQPKHLCMLWRAFSPDWMTACTDTYASHVFHSLILRFPTTFDLDAKTISADHDSDDDDDDDDDDDADEKTKKKNGDADGDQTTSGREMFLEFCTFLKENLMDLITNVYGTHIVRAVLQVLSNLPVANSITVVHQKKKDSYKESLHESKPDETFHKQFFKISKLIINSSHFTFYTSDKAANPVLQLLVHITCQLKQKKGEKLCKKLIRLCGFFDVPPVDPESSLTDHTRLPLLMMDSYATYLVQLLLQHCSEELFLTWFESSFKDRLIAYAVHEQSNYVLTRAIDKCSDKEMFSSIFDEIMPYLEDMLSMKHMGVVKSLIQKCLSLGTKQKKMVKKLLDAFHCAEDDNKILIIPCLLSMKTSEVYLENIIISDEVEKPANPEKFAKLSINIHGSMIVQTLLNYGNPKMFIESFLHLTPKQMISVMCDYYGNFILKEYFKSSTISERNKDAVLEKMSGSYSLIACDRIGSHSWQDIWPYLSINQKTAIAEELCQQIEKVRRNKYGYYVQVNLALNTFSHNRQQWQTSQTSSTNKRKMFDEIIDEKKSKKSKKSSESKENNCLNSGDQPDDAIDFDLFKQKIEVEA